MNRLSKIKFMRFIILDDHLLFSQGISNILAGKYNDAVIKIYSSIASLTEKELDLSEYDIIISDIELPNEDIFEFLKNVKEQHCNLPVLIVSMHNKLSVIKKCKDLDIEGYILKDDQVKITDIIELIVGGGKFYSDRVLSTLEILNKKEKVLTPKEEQIVTLIVKGESSADILEKLYVSPNTLKTHKKNIFRKLEINSTTELVKYYYDNYI